MNNEIHEDDNFSRIFREQLDVLRVYGAKFAQENPDLAPYLETGHRKNHDPETERLIESFAFMIAQLETKIIE
ncbi:MAG: type VI secretion system baseplate subunit TssF, partial [Silvanigrellaceae bacterium]|nr:type VI secretion system baseplate subunit TssF [Silvanigrellaceae bacterium]